MSNEKAIAKNALNKAMNNIKRMMVMIDNSSTTTSGGKNTKVMFNVAPRSREYTTKTKYEPGMGGSLSMNMKTGESVYKPRKTRIF